jgi:hypothetical protein
VQDNTRLVPPLVFHPAPTHLGRGTQRFHWSFQETLGSETPTTTIYKRSIIWEETQEEHYKEVHMIEEHCTIQTHNVWILM